MNINDNFSENEPDKLQTVFKQHNVPVFQNKVYPSRDLALSAEKGEVVLMQSLVSGFIFNDAFIPHIMNYDVHYQNEQSNSDVFKNHLQDVLGLLKSFGIADKKVVEVGCGKAVFFDMMLGEGIDCWGFDPTYEGDNKRIKKEYFDETHQGIAANVIVMRHTLEHITKPFSFLHTIAKANDYRGFLFVEVPTFDWIVEHNAFWDIFYEHCNYFTEESLAVMFDDAVTGNFFNGQYIYLWADLSKIKTTIPENHAFKKYDTSAFRKKLKQYEDMLSNTDSLAIWGAGAKGSTFLNLLDKKAKSAQYVIDINPAKQNKFIAGTGHPIYSPDILLQQPVENILIMNENYETEIVQQLNQFNLSIKTSSL
ncbi:MAG: class I SAM-dependent methyltransferase [Ferruginibacter sp.]